MCDNYTCVFLCTTAAMRGNHCRVFVFRWGVSCSIYSIDKLKLVVVAPYFQVAYSHYYSGALYSTVNRLRRLYGKGGRITLL